MSYLPEFIAGPRRYRITLLLFLIVAGLNLGLNLDRPLVPGIHEMRVLETAREMQESGDYIIPHFIGDTRLQKPPLPYWGSALAYSVVGEPSAKAARMVVALLGLLTLIATYWIARAREENPSIAVASVAILTSFILFLTEFRTVTTNSYLTAMVTVSVAAFAWSMRRSGVGGYILLLVGYLGLGLALMSKGPIALVFVAIGVWFMRPPGYIADRSLWMLHGFGILIALLPILVWVVFVATHLENALEVWRFEVIGRLSGTLEGDRPFWFYGPVLLGAEAPLIVLFFAALFKRDGQANPYRAWFLFGMVFLTLLSTRSAAYILPLMPVVAILIARYTMLYARTGILGVQVVVNLIMAAGLFGVVMALGINIHTGYVLLLLLLGAATITLGYQSARRVVSISSILFSAIMITGYFQTGIKAGLPDDLSLYNLGTFIHNVIPSDEPLFADCKRESRIGFLSQRSPNFVDGVDVVMNASGPRWLLSSHALNNVKHGPEFRTQTEGGTEYFLYRLP